MATQEEQNFVTKTRNEFVMSAENAIKEIRDKFVNFHSQLDQGESDLINNVEKVQADILQKFDEITPKLKEIQQCRDSVVSILRNNSNKQLLETQLSSLTAEIDGVIGKSEIDKLIKLKWKYCELPINDVCTIATMSPKESVKHSPQANIIHERPGAYTHPQPEQDTRFPPNTPNKPQDFRMNPSRDADETHRGNQPSEMLGGRDASETHNPKTQDYKSQTSSGESMPKFYDPQYQNQGLGIRSSTPRGAASPSITPKSTHERNEQTLVKTESEGAFQTKAFGRSGSSHLHGIDEKKHSHEHKISGVKEQGSNSPNYSGNKNTSELQSANTQQQYQQYEYGETVNPQRNSNPQDPNIQLPAPNMQDYGHGVGNVSHPVNVRVVQGYPPQESANPRAYQGQKEDPNIQLPAPNMQDYGHGVGNVSHPVNVRAVQGYPPQESANPRAYQGQKEDPNIQLPAPNMQDYGHGVGNVSHPVNVRVVQGYPPQESANPRAYQGQKEDPNIQLPAPNMQDYGHGVGNVSHPVNVRAVQGYPPQESANPRAYQGQKEDPTRQLPAPNMQDYSHGAGNVAYHVYIPSDQGYPLQEPVNPAYPGPPPNDL